MRRATWGRRHAWCFTVVALASCDHGFSRPNTATVVQHAKDAPSRTSSVAWDEPRDVATGPAHVGPWRMNESEFHYVDDPSVALADDGSVGVVWADNRRQTVYFQRHDAEGRPLHEPVDVSRSPDTFSWLPRVTMASEGEVFVLWQEIVFSGGSHGGEIFFARSEDEGASFESPINLSHTMAGAGKGRLTPERWSNGSLDLARTSGGTLIAAWTEYEGPLRLSRSQDAGRTFEAPRHVFGDDELPARGPSLAVGPDDVVHLAWTVGEAPTADIRIARSEHPAKDFSRPVVVESPGRADTPHIAVDDSGTVHLVYTEHPPGPRTRPRLRYARSLGGGPFEPAEIPVVRGSAGASSPALALDGAGTMVVFWEHHPGGEARPRGIGFTWSRDGGRTFEPASLVPGTTDPALGFNGSLQGDLMRKLAVSEAGAIAVVNSSFLPDRVSRIRLIRGHTQPRAARADSGDKGP
jgi:hypothetical protein